MCAERTRAQAGQALVETLVLGIALVPLAVLVVLLGKYQSIQSATVAASRSLAFDCAVRPQSCSDPAAAGWLAESLRSRHFSRLDTPPLSGERAVGVQPLWHDRTGRPLLDHLTDVGAAVSAQRFDAGLGTALGRASSASGGAGGGSGSSGPSPAEVLDRLAGPARFGLAIDGGLLDARVQVAVASSQAGRAGFARLDPMPVTMRARTVILADAWQASGPRGEAGSVEARSGAGARLDPLREGRLTVGYQLTRWAIDLMGAFGLEPAARQFRYHEIDPGAIPADRVGAP